MVIWSISHNNERKERNWKSINHLLLVIIESNGSCIGDGGVEEPYASVGPIHDLIDAASSRTDSKNFIHGGYPMTSIALNYVAMEQV